MQSGFSEGPTRRLALRRPLWAGALAAALGALAFCGPLRAEPTAVLQSSAGPLEIHLLHQGLTEPWGLAFLPDGSPLVTERGGRLWHLGAAGAVAIGGLPEVFAQGQGGLLDVLVPRDFATSREIWLSYAAPMRGGAAATAVGRGRLAPDGQRLEGFERLWAGDAAPGGRHFGARLVEAPDGRIFVTTGDRGTGPKGRAAQEGGQSHGKVIALARSGAPGAAGRPDWAPGVVSIGHRNIQGAALDGEGALWIVDHGAKGGDEVNRITAGENYGWPLVSHGRDYDGSRIGLGAEGPGVTPPRHVWDPSIAPSGLLVYQGDRFPGWQGSLLTGSLKFGQIHRLAPGAAGVVEVLEAPQTARLRDLRQGPDGAIWFLSVGQGALFRMVPKP